MSLLPLAERRKVILEEQGRVWDAAGLRNFYGQGWRHSWLLRWLGLDLTGSTFVTKTITAEPREGNTPLGDDLMTVDWHPQSVVVKFWGCHTLNAWGLSGPGAEVALEELARLAEQGVFTKLQISFMPVGDDPDDLLKQTRKFVALLKARMHRFVGVRLIIQLNASCPNTGHGLETFRTLLAEHLNILGSELDTFIVLKESVDIPFRMMRDMVEHHYCSGIVTTNCVKFGNLSDVIPWSAIYGDESPLRKYGGGGYSGPYLLPLVLERVQQYRESRYDGFIAAGGGIRRSREALSLLRAGADAICIGATLANYRPWNTRAVIRAAESWEG